MSSVCSPKLQSLAVAVISFCLFVSLVSCGGDRATTSNPGGSGSSSATQVLYSISPSSSGTGTSIAAFGINSTGTLTLLGTALQSSTGTSLPVSTPNGHYLFAVTTSSAGVESLVTFTVQSNHWTLLPTSFAALPANTGYTGAPIILNSTGNLLFIALRTACNSPVAQCPGYVATYSVSASGTLTLVPTSSSSFGVNVLAPVSIAINPEGTFLYVATFNASQYLVIFQLSVLPSGQLQVVNTLSTSVQGGTTLAMAPDGNTLYWGLFSSPGVAAFPVAPITGVLTQGPIVSCNCNGSLVPGGEGAYIAVNATSTLLFQTTIGESASGNGVLVYLLSQNTGVPSFVNHTFLVVGGNGSPSIASSSNGQFLYATAPGTSRILGFNVFNSGVAIPLPGSPFTQAGGGTLTILNFTP